MREAFVELYKHHLWANQRLLEVCQPLSADALDATAAGTYGTIRDTLVHLFAAEGRYLAAMTGQGEQADALREGSFPGFAVLTERGRASGERLLTLAERATENETISVDRGGQHYDIPISIFFAQAINHGTDHRAHVCTVLTQQGIEPPNLDLWNYLRSGGNR
jgi:uncharacterized damage-inducible protein DinB